MKSYNINQRQAHHCHPSLLVDEVLSRIFSNLRCRALAASAVTCQAWKEPALDTLWSSVNLDDLLDVLSPATEGDEGLVSRANIRFTLLKCMNPLPPVVLQRLDSRWMDAVSLLCS